MWPRKQLDIGWTDLAFGLAQVVAPRAQLSARCVVGDDWVPAEEAILALSVRSGLDLLFTGLRLPPGSEVIVSAVTIPDMVRIIQHHGLVPVPVDVDAETLQPVAEHLERSIGPRTRAIVVAHLFGTHIDMGPIIELAKLHSLIVIEDCAQAFVGNQYAGHPESDCSLFSFGPIKTATALGGAVLRVRDAELRRRMIELQQSYPIQPRMAYFRRLLKYAAFRFVSKPVCYGIMVRLLGWFGKDYDQALGNAAHSFRKHDFFTQIRRRPSTTLLKMLRRRIRTFEQRGMGRLRKRTERGARLLRAVGGGMVVGERNETHTYWVVPVRVANRDEVLEGLRAAGFDATARSSLIVVAPANGASLDEPALAPWLAETIFLPSDEVPDSEWDRLVAILEEIAIAPPLREHSELVALTSVSSAT